ncbi:MAG: FKBP-type peptidyl-prolyl cis-trans isomerase, partial [Bacteroidota bacterium]
MKTIFLLLVTSLIFLSCGGYSEEEKSKFDSEIQPVIKKNQWVMTKSESGVYEQILKEGSGKEIHLGDVLIVEYKGMLTNGTVFDKTTKPIELPLSSLIAGWKEVLVGKKVGCETRFICPPNMAYGRSARERIPENSTLVFEVK